MDIFTNLPFDIQFMIYNIYKKNKYIHSLVKSTPIVLIKHYHCKNNCYYNNNIGDNIFNLRITLRCDKNDLCWINCQCEFASYIGYCYNLFNIPIEDINNIDNLIRKTKEVFMEYIKYNHNYGKFTFKNCLKTYYEIQYLNFETFKYDSIDNLVSMPHKLLKKIIKKQWFDEKHMDIIEKNKDLIINNECAFPNFPDKYLRFFRIDDNIIDLGSEYIRVPYTYDDCIHIKDKLPIIYKLLDKYGCLISPYIDSKPLRQLLNLYIKKQNVTDFENLLEIEDYNSEVEQLIKDILNHKNYKNIIMPETGIAYIADKPHELLSFLVIDA